MQRGPSMQGLNNVPPSRDVVATWQGLGVSVADVGWADRFHSNHGRRPRVLHLCNIGNYALVNARIQRKYGIDADVFDPDFYHIMSAPEWIDVDFKPRINNHYMPNWSKQAIGRYKRPKWFLQAPSLAGLAWLAARASGDQLKEHKARNIADWARRISTRDMPLPVLWAATVTSGPVAWLRRAATRVLVWNRGTPRPATPSVRPLSVTEITNDVGVGDSEGAGSPTGVPAEIEALAAHRDLLAKICAHYDVVHCYTLLGTFPLAVGARNFVSMELGTLRGLPFVDGPVGSLTRWVYSNSPRVMITNTDCVEPARRMGLDKQKTAVVPHPFDVAAAQAHVASRPLRRQYVDRGRPLQVLAPARHRWVDGNASELKGNDTYIYGLAEARRRNLSFRVTLVEWGEDVAASKALINQLQLDPYIRWISPEPQMRLWRRYDTSAVIIDQFCTAALGSVALQALALGRPLLTRYDNAAANEVFGSPPPLLNCASPDDVGDALVWVSSDPEGARALGERGRAWVDETHSEEAQLHATFATYEALCPTL